MHQSWSALRGWPTFQLHIAVESLLSSAFPHIKMDTLSLNVRIREATGRGSSRRIRKEGEIPAVVYGKSGSQALSVNEKEFRQLWKSIHGGAALIELKDESGKDRLTTVKDLQIHPIKDSILHIDFNEVIRGEAMTTTVPVVIEGEAEGVKVDGGVLSVLLHDTEIKTLPRNLPESLVIDISALKLGESTHLSDIQLPEGVELTGDPETVIATVGHPQPEEEVAPAEEVAADSVPTTREEAEAAKEAE